VKSANNGFDIYMLFRWNDSAGPSFLADPEMYRAPNGSLIPLTPEATANVTQLFYNSTYYYPDRVAVLWFIANQSERQESPRMMLGTNGAITGGAAEIWHWQSNPTDNNPNDTGFPGGYTNPTGAPIYPPDNLSFAEDDYTNTTGFFVIAGSFGSGSPNLDPYADPFMIHVGSYYSYSNKTWTVEMVRSFTTSQASSYRVQLATGSSYFIAMAVWQGKLGESAEFKSVSLWYNLTVSSHIAPSKAITASSPSSGVPISLASAVAVASVIVGLVIGTVLRSSSNSEKRSDKGGMKR
jgi:cytochrome b558/566 subunit A